ncbi:MAG TPA: hypothetical protein VJ997_06460 [Longimicrobiales bacterium]|nr:hypothetical protein [Longimicrobiales bacterium]
MNAPTTLTADKINGTVPRSIGLHGRVAVLSAMAGGVSVGGILVGAMTLTGRLSGNAIFATATALFIIGAFLGLIHGVALGYLGRPAGVTPRQARGDLGRAALYAIPGLSVAWLASIWVAMTIVAFYTGRTGAIVGAAVGWIGAGAIVAVAAVQAVRALKNAYARWPERRAGTLLAAASFAALLMTFLADRPEIWGVRLRLTEVGAVLLAAVLAVWVAGPVVTVALRLARSVPFTRPMAGLGTGRTTAKDLGIGLAVGLVVGLMAVPFTGPAAPAAVGTVVVGVSQALVNEVLLRLFAVTAVAWLLLRWNRLGVNEALVGAVVAATLIQVVLYAPGAAAIGFASWTGTALFLTVGVALPATAFGVLFLRRGFTTALIADVTALAAIALLA